MSQQAVSATEGFSLPPSVSAGVERLVHEYGHARDHDRAVVVYSPDSRLPAAWVILALQRAGVDVRPVHMQPRPMDDPGLPERLAKVLPDPRPGRLLLITLERDSMSHVHVFQEALQAYALGQWTTIRIINACTEFFTHGLAVGPALLSAINSGLLHRFKRASNLLITTSSGTELHVALDCKYRWMSNRGMPKQGGFIILPPGEVSTYPSSISGTFVVDGAFNVNAFTKVNPALRDTPVTIKLEDNRLTSYECADPSLDRLVSKVLEFENTDRVGELGFGTNVGNPEFIQMNSHLNERRPGVHVGLGQHNQTLELVPYLSPIHLDLISSDAKVWVDDDPDCIDFHDLHPSELPHPLDVDDEDIDGDCCGLFTS